MSLAIVLMLLRKILRHVNDIITKELNESFTSIRDCMIESLKEENFRLQQKVQHLENKLSDIRVSSRILGQHLESSKKGTFCEFYPDMS